MDWGNDFNGTSSDFGLDTQSLEETSLLWTHTGVLGWDDDVDWGDGTLSSWGGNFVLQNQVSNGFEIFVGENKTDVGDQKWEDLFVVWEFVEKSSNTFLHHGVLAHNDGGFSSERSSDLSKL